LSHPDQSRATEKPNALHPLQGSQYNGFLKTCSCASAILLTYE